MQQQQEMRARRQRPVASGNGRPGLLACERLHPHVAYWRSGPSAGLQHQQKLTFVKVTERPVPAARHWTAAWHLTWPPSHRSRQVEAPPAGEVQQPDVHRSGRPDRPGADTRRNLTARRRADRQDPRGRGARRLSIERPARFKFEVHLRTARDTGAEVLRVDPLACRPVDRTSASPRSVSSAFSAATRAPDRDDDPDAVDERHQKAERSKHREDRDAEQLRAGGDRHHDR